MGAKSQGREPDVLAPLIPRPITRTNTSRSSIWRSTLVLSFASCYIMWGTSVHTHRPRCSQILLWKKEAKHMLTRSAAIVFLAQWHPLIEPKMGKLRPGYAGGS